MTTYTGPVSSRPDKGAPTTKHHHVMQVFLNVSMIKAHNGLSELMLENGIEPKALLPGQFVVFINHARTRAKIFTAHDVIGYIRDEGRINLQAIARIPQAFGAHGNFDMREAYQLAIETGLAEEEAQEKVVTKRPMKRAQATR